MNEEEKAKVINRIKVGLNVFETLYEVVGFLEVVKQEILMDYLK